MADENGEAGEVSGQDTTPETNEVALDPVDAWEVRYRQALDDNMKLAEQLVNTQEQLAKVRRELLKKQRREQEGEAAALFARLGFKKDTTMVVRDDKVFVVGPAGGDGKPPEGDGAAS